MSTFSKRVRVAPAVPGQPQPRKKTRPLRLGCLLFALALVSITETHVFHFVVRQAFRFEAWRQGGRVFIGAMDGSVFEPIRFYRSHWHYRSPNGAVTRIEVEQAEAEFAWKNVFRNSSNRWLRRLSLKGVTGKIDLGGESGAAPSKDAPPWYARARAGSRWLPTPADIHADVRDFVFCGNDNYLRVEDAHFATTELGPGVIEARRIVVRQPWLRRTFRDVRGTTALRETKATITDLTLEPGIQIEGFSAGVADLAKGALDAQIQVAAFGGLIRCAAKTTLTGQDLSIYANGTFSEINAGQLATFLSLSEAAGGTIKDGIFSFRGTPGDFREAAARLYFEVTDFQWESRQWDSLVLGTEYVERRLQVHKLALRQGKNELDLTGDLALPAGLQQWRESEFNWNIAARIENLTDLSALLLPEFQYAAGSVGIDGSVRGKDQQFHGQLIVSGSGLQWRNAPIAELHAALKLDGNDIQITNFSLFNEGDFVRGRAKINLLGDKKYSGELRATVQDLAAYAALLQPPLFPEPLAGGASLDWNGDGSAQGHRGKFVGRLRNARSIGAAASRCHPIDAHLEGTYGPGKLVFDKFALSDDESALVSNVAVGDGAVVLEGIRLTHREQIWLQGEAVLPITVRLPWSGDGPVETTRDQDVPNVKAPTAPDRLISTGLNRETVGRVNLKASNLELREASLLTGWKFPIEGVVNGQIAAEGRLGEIRGNGQLSVINGKIAVGPNGAALSDVQIEASLRDQELALEKCTGAHRFLDFALHGTLGLKNVGDPYLKLTLRSERVSLPLFQTPAHRARSFPAGARQASWQVETTAAVDLSVEGPASGALVEGRAQLTGLSLGGAPDLTALWTAGPPVQAPPVFSLLAPPWNAWRFAIDCRTAAPLRLEGDFGTVSAHVRLIGTGRAPALAGAIHVENAGAFIGPSPATVEEAHLEFSAARITDPTLDLRVRASLFGNAYEAQAAGPLSHLIHTYTAEPPLTLRLVRSFFTGPMSWRANRGADRPFSLGLSGAAPDRLLVIGGPETEDPASVSAPMQARKPEASNGPSAPE